MERFVSGNNNYKYFDFISRYLLGLKSYKGTAQTTSVPGRFSLSLTRKNSAREFGRLRAGPTTAETEVIGPSASAGPCRQEGPHLSSPSNTSLPDSLETQTADGATAALMQEERVRK